MTSNRKRINKTAWLIPAALILLSVVPVAAGAFRIVQLTGGGEITPENARFFASPMPVVGHIVSSILYSILGAFQFSPSLRRWKPGWHGAVGKWILAPAGLVAALSGLWMTLFYPGQRGMGYCFTGCGCCLGRVWPWPLSWAFLPSGGGTMPSTGPG
jgi:hypothetical protein